MKNIITIAFLCLTFNFAQAQSFEAGIFLGASFYSGDLQPKRFTSSESHVAIGGVFKYQVLEYLTVRASVLKGTISGHDFNSTKASGRYSRNLSFKSDILEYGIQGEFHPFPFIFDSPKRISPYLVTGVGLLNFNPQTYYQEKWYDLQPLGTEGQYLEGSGVSPYSLTQLIVPVGLGVNFIVSDYNSISLEFAIRQTFTDYLDDVSTKYPDLTALSSQNATAAILSYRGDELLEEPSSTDFSGKKRGGAAKDYYTFFGINFNFNLSGMMNTSEVGRYEVF